MRLQKNEKDWLILMVVCSFLTKKTENQCCAKYSLAGKTFPFHKDEESDGTQRLLDLLPILFGLTAKASVYFIDEIDRCLHTKLTRTFINDFIAKEHKNQLIFTSHDINLISLEDLAQDEIWFLEKLFETIFGLYDTL